MPQAYQVEDLCTLKFAELRHSNYEMDKLTRNDLRAMMMIKMAKASRLVMTIYDNRFRTLRSQGRIFIHLLAFEGALFLGR